MSWRKQRVYKCDVCGREVPMHRNFAPGAPGFWRHAGNRHGFTICDECRAAIKWARTARERENAAKRAAEIARERACRNTVALIASAFKKYGDSMSGGDNDKED